MSREKVNEMGFAEQLTFNMIKPSMMTGKYLTIVRRKLNIKKETKTRSY